MSDFDEIYRLYAKTVYGFLLRISGNPDIAEELASETFYRAVKNIGKFSGSCKISVWLCEIAKNLYTDYLRKSERKNIPLEDKEFPDSGDIILRFEDKEQVLNIHRILHTLDEPYKEVFSLRVFSELSYKEIASLFGKSDGWARVIFFRAKEMILKELKNSDNERN